MMHEVKLQFEEEEVLVFMARKKMKPWVMKLAQNQQHVHGSLFVDVKPIEQWVVLYEKRITPMYEAFDKMIKKELLK